MLELCRTERRIQTMEGRPHPQEATSTGFDEIELDAGYRLLTEEAGVVPRETLESLDVTGVDAIEFLQGQLTNDLEQLEPSSAVYAALLDRKAHLVADCRVLLIDSGQITLVAEATAIEALASHLETYRIGRQVEVRNRTGERCVISVIGAATRSFLDTPSVGREDRHLEMTLGGIVCRALGTLDGVDLICSADQAEPLRTALREKGLTEVPEDAAEILRVESGRPRFGFELDRSVMPAEGGIVERAVDFEKGCYLGQEPVARLHYKGRPNRLLRGLRLTRPSHSGEVINGNGRELGRIATACVSPALGPIALALVRREAEPGAAVSIGDDGASAEVVELPLRTG